MTMMARTGMMVSAEKAMPCQNCEFMFEPLVVDMVLL